MKRILSRLLSYIPTQLPLGLTAYKAWSDEVVELIGPIANSDDLHFCVAAEVLRVGPSANAVSKNYFVKRVRAGATKQLAGHVFSEIKERQQAAQKAEAEALKLKQAEDTALKAVPANEQAQ